MHRFINMKLSSPLLDFPTCSEQTNDQIRQIEVSPSSVSIDSPGSPLSNLDFSSSSDLETDPVEDFDNQEAATLVKREQATAVVKAFSAPREGNTEIRRFVPLFKYLIFTTIISHLALFNLISSLRNTSQLTK